MTSLNCGEKAEAQYVCKHCGSDRFSASVAVRTTVRGDVRVRDGKPYFDGHPDFIDMDPFDEDEYHCDECDASELHFKDLVKVKQAEDELHGACGRCDHDVTHHPLPEHKRAKYPDYYTRPAMPCTVDGCDCHDYYDVALSLPVAA